MRYLTVPLKTYINSRTPLYLRRMKLLNSGHAILVQVHDLFFLKCLREIRTMIGPQFEFYGHLPTLLTRIWFYAALFCCLVAKKD